MTANYYCSNTSCEDQIKIIYDFNSDENDKIIKEVIIRKKLNIIIKKILSDISTRS